MDDQEQLIGLPDDWPFDADEWVVAQPFTNGQINEDEERIPGPVTDVLSTIYGGVVADDWAPEEGLEEYQDLKLRLVSNEQGIAVDILWYGPADAEDNASKYLQQI